MRPRHRPALPAALLAALIAGGTAAWRAPAGGQEPPAPPAGSAAAKPASEPAVKEAPGPIHALVGGTVMPISSPVAQRGIVLFQGGKILAAGSELSIPEGAVVHDVTGKFITPGLVAIEASVGNARYVQGSFADALDPYHRDLHIAIACGITTLQVINTGFGGFFGSESPAPAGQATAVIKATVEDLDGMLLKEPSALYLPFRRSMLSIQQLQDSFRRAREHLRQVEEAVKGGKKPPETPRGLELHVLALKRELPVVIQADERDEIRAILDLRREFDFDLVLSGATEGWMMAPEIAARGVPVLLRSRGRDFNFGFEEPLLEEGDMIPIRRPAAFDEAGVQVVLLPYRRGISLDGLAGRDLTALPFEAAYAVRGGMKETAALRAITLEPARVLRIDDRVGSLAPGKDADILLWSGHPLHYRSYVESAWINGRLYYERSKSPLFKDIPPEDETRW